jgi:lysozyme
MRRISKAGRDLIKRHEGLRLDAYVDPVGVWTIGYGHTGPAARKGNTITKDRADNLLTQDVREAEAAVTRLVKMPLSDGQFDALVSFVFNVGAAAFAQSTLLRELNAGRFAAVPGQLRRWVYGTVSGQKVILPGLVKRRNDEAVLWASASAIETDETAEAGVIAEPPPANPAAAQSAAGLSVGGVLSVVGARATESDAALYVFVGIALAVSIYLWIRRNRAA